MIVEVKADNQIEDAVVQAKKDFAQQIAVASGMEYRILQVVRCGQAAVPGAAVNQDVEMLNNGATIKRARLR